MRKSLALGGVALTAGLALTGLTTNVATADEDPLPKTAPTGTAIERMLADEDDPKHQQVVAYAEAWEQARLEEYALAVYALAVEQLEAERAAAAAAAAAAQAASGGGGGGDLASIRACESGGNYGAVSSSGRYRGAYQFDQQTWESVGGSGDPAAASPAEQDARARALQQQRGSSPWPNCG